MTGLRSPGISSGLDVNGLVTQLVAAERAPTAQRIQRQESRITVQTSALAVLKGALSTLQTALSPLRTETAFQTRTTTASDPAVFTASATSAATAGSYSIEVVRLASAHKLASNVFAGGAGSAVGTGTLTIGVGAETFDVLIDTPADTLTAIRDAINAAPSNTGVSATLVNVDGGSRLMLTSTATGAANTIRVTTSGGNGGLASLVYDPPTTSGNYSELATAQDALVRIEGFDVTSSNNTITGAIDGVSLNLLSARSGTVLTLTVANDNAQAIERVKKFVADFNSAASVMTGLRRYNPTTRDAGPLVGDSMLRGIESSIRRHISATVSSASAPYDTLAGIGITTNTDGSLKLDESKLSSALSADFAAVGTLFGSADGVGARLHADLEAKLATTAQLTTRSEGLQAQKRALDNDRAALDRRMQAVEARYRAQFASLDTLLAGLQTTANFLSAQLDRK